ncbi:MAG: adenylate/guanylate cyclase domain-containing protein [Spirochaetes bacterium]|nr:adenylate/guanylate cyclase domain-containing protein [Spirochaetota bacterium]MBN2771927.1 adenylate/guanylate cyclase domain-containing protein [Spirochaetota bacterium]
MKQNEISHLKQYIFFLLLSGLGGGFFGLVIPKYSDPEYSIALSFCIGFLIGFCICVLAILFDNKFKIIIRKYKMPLLLELSIRTLYYALIIPAVFYSIFYIFRLQEEISTLLFPVMIYSLGASFFINMLAIIINLIGPPDFLRLISGRYSRPFEEERIFMFIDIKGSTALAENLGNLKFHSFLNDFIFFITPSILECKGEIYKYIGDEIIVSWNTKNALKHLNCLRIFFLIVNSIQDKKSYFETEYGTVPEFRAGIHIGKVIVGEMGDIKKEIAYLGDVVNTTARIISVASERSLPLLGSKDIVNFVSNNKLKTDYLFTEIKEVILRGKSNQSAVYQITENIM